MKTHHGFSLIGITVIIACLGVAALIAWRIYEANTKTTPTPQASQHTDGSAPQNDSPGETNTKSYTSKDTTFTFAYPSDWTLQQEAVSGEQVNLSSPDVVTSEPPIGGITVDKGAIVVLTAYKCQATCSIQNAYDGIYDTIAKNRSTVTVADVQAARFEYGYEGQPTLATKFYRNGYVYTVLFNTGGNDFNNQYRTAYDTIVNSFKFTAN